MKKKMVFLTGTRADYGKLKPLIRNSSQLEFFETYLYVTGMHALQAYGYTVEEIVKDGFENILVTPNQFIGESMDSSLANTIMSFSRYAADLHPDLIVVHGDRLEALAGAIVGAFRNITVIHIEGGEVSGTIDESIRHAISKLAHVHMVASEKHKKRLIQLGEDKNFIFTIGSPDIDIMLSHDLPLLENVKKHYDIDFESFAILLYHAVTTESTHELKTKAEAVVDALIESNQNYVVIYPNNDEGCELILGAYQKLKNRKNIVLLPSMRFEAFLTLLKNCQFIIGNSSSGIREAPIYAKYTINLGKRQNGRYAGPSIVNCVETKENILSTIHSLQNMKKLKPDLHFGDGKASQRFVNIIRSGILDKIVIQKQFIDLIDEYKL